MLDRLLNSAILFPHMNNKLRNLRLKVAHYYLNNDVSLRKTALMFGVAYRTVFQWVKLYKEQGEERLLSNYKRPWNRVSQDLEKKIILMKEADPRLTVRQTRENLKKEGFKLSIKGIWGIWKRYGYAGFSQRNMSSNLTDCLWSREAIVKFGRAKNLFDLGSIEKSAEILNSIPALPQNELLPQFPDSFLNTRRQIEKIGLLFGKIPVRVYLKRLANLCDECCRQHLYYSALIIGLAEAIALSWCGGPSKTLKKTAELRDLFRKTGDYYSHLLFAPRLSLLVSEGIAYAKLLRIEKALATAKTCCKLLKRKKHIAPHFLRDIGQLYIQLGDFKAAEYWCSKSLDKSKEEGKKLTKSLLAGIFVTKGEYKKALCMIRENERPDYWGYFPETLRIQSVWSLIRGMPHKAISLAIEALSLLKKEELKMNMFGCYFTIASAYCSLGETARARHTLKGFLPFLTKNRLEDMKTVTEIILSEKSHAACSIPAYGQTLPTVKVALLLKKGQYIKALKCAKNKGILSFFHRSLFFFPETIINLLEKGKSTYLPRTLLNLPVFRKEIPVYSVKFLGDLIIHKNQKHLRVKLKPKDTAFMIHLSISKSRCIPLSKIYRNFWPRSKNPSRNLAHLLVRIRKALCLPSHFLYIKGSRLFFDCHFITDYGDYLEYITQAKVFLRIGEWDAARDRYMHAFSLFRDAPFKKVYDEWSENMRHMIVSQLENETIKFMESYSAHGEQRECIKTLRTISKIIPDTNEIKNCIDNATAG
jgi:tetratricopeptide (TPR) repeat protein